MKQTVAIVGLGSIGRRHADNLLALGCEVVGVDLIGVDAEVRFLTLKTFDDLELFPLTHAIICSPPHLHYEHARYFIRRGMPTFIEKPITTSLQDAKVIYALAAQRCVPVAVGYMERANPTVLAARKFSQEHPIKHAYIECYWKMAKKSYEQDALLESSHAFDTARFILGDMQLQALARDRKSAELMLHGSNGNCYVTVNADALPMRRINLYAHDGKSFGRQYGTEPGEWDACYQAELKAFLNGQPICTAEDGFRVMEILEALK